MPKIGKSDCEVQPYVLESFLLRRKYEVEAQKTNQLKSDSENKPRVSRGAWMPDTQENTQGPHEGNEKPDRQYQA